MQSSLLGPPRQVPAANVTAKKNLVVSKTVEKEALGAVFARGSLQMPVCAAWLPAFHGRGGRGTFFSRFTESRLAFALSLR